jgi:phosphonate transport system ATP-binding protein
MFTAYPSAKLGGDMLRIDILTNHFGDKIAVDAANISVNEPSMIGIIGRSGAGKFTLLRMVNRLSDATSGTITYQCEDITSLRGAARRNWQSRCALIFQQFNVVPRMDVVSNVLHGLCFANRPEIELPLSPDGLSLRRRYMVCQEL